jgi:hypothetical protein
MSAKWRDEVKVCPCGAKFWPTHGMTEGYWRTRVLCSRKCAALARWSRERERRAA